MRLVIAFMLLALVALLTSGTAAAPIPAADFCEGCQGQCRSEAYHVFSLCRDNGGTVAQCDAQSDQYVENCNTLFCPSCGPIAH